MSAIRIGIGFGGFRELPAPDVICRYAEVAEDLGIDSIWFSDRIVSSQPHLDLACVMALFAARTKRIKMGPSVLTLPAREPIQVARTYATLDYLTGGCGRVIMAVGLGNAARDCVSCGVPAAERAARLEEGVHVLRELWSRPNVTHRGRFYRFENVTVEPRPARGPLDVWIGGRTDPALRRAAKYGDGWFPSFVTPEEFRDGMRRLTAYGAEHGRAIDPGEAGTLLLTLVTEDASQARAVTELAGAAFRLSPEAMGERSLIGPLEACAERLRSYVEAGCTKFVLFPLAGPDDLLPQVETYGRRLVPRFA